jgi:hypothetical protein
MVRHVLQGKTEIETCVHIQRNALINFFVTSNSSFEQMNNIFFKKMLSFIPEIPVLGIFKFRNTYLPGVMDKMNQEISRKLNKSFSIRIVVDIWTDLINSDFIGIAALVSISIDDSPREVLAINMLRMSGNHTSENVKKAVEDGINVFDFDKSKVHGKYLLIQ